MKTISIAGLMSAGLLVAPMASAALDSETITFDEAVNGLPFFNFDSSDPDDTADVIFSTTDPFGFNTAGPGPFQLYIQELGLEGTTIGSPDLRVDFLQGAVGTIQFGFALSAGFGLIEEGQVTFTAYDVEGAAIGSATVSGDYFALPEPTDSEEDFGDSPTQSVFQENEVTLELSGVATYGEFDFSLDSGDLVYDGIKPFSRYIVDNFTFTPSSEDILADFEGALPEDPVMPGEIKLDENDVPEFVFDVTVDSDGLGGAFPMFIDPIIAVGYDYVVSSGPNFASVLIPDALPNGDDTFTLTLPGISDFTLTAGETFDLTAHDPSGFDSFTISGIDTTELLDPTDPLAFVTGVTYVGAGPANLSMTPITQNVPASAPTGVPEPPTLVLAAFALFALVWNHRKALR